MASVSSLCGKRKRATLDADETKQEETMCKRLNTLHVSTPLSDGLMPKRRRETLDDIENNADYGYEKYTQDSKGKKQGLYQAWYANGQRRELANYCDGHEDGLVQHWYPDGKPFTIYTICRGLKEGNVLTWFPSGMLKAYEPFFCGLLHGIVKHFSESGEKQYEAYYEQGILIKETYWSSNGNVFYDYSLSERNL
jgi:antitoxin component YwqK of YwqJK toxin-antitoxin module